IAPGFVFGNGKASVVEDPLKGANRSEATKVDRGPCPVQDDRFERAGIASGLWNARIQKRRIRKFHAAAALASVKVSSEIPKDIVIPIPLVTVTTRPPGSGSTRRYGCSGCLA